MSDYSEIGNDEKALYLLSWLDVVERLDTLILEARHLQKNIIYLLHAPTLYQPLRYEESWLWGNDSERAADVFENKKNNLNLEEETAEFISHISILPYPRPSDKDSFYTEWSNFFKDIDIKGIFDNHSEEETKTEAKTETKTETKTKTEKIKPEDISNNINKVLDHLIYEGVWNRDQRSLYHMLISIQDLKRNILKDKWELTLYAFSFLERETSTKYCRTTASRLLMLRNVILARAQQYLARLNDHMVAFRLHTDFSAQDHPSMSTERRRDGHLYSVFLRDRCRDLAIEMRGLVSHLGVEITEDKYSNIYHRWQHDHTSHSHSLNDKMNLNKSNGTTFQHFINTSYWMPERPDLQSVIAHEISHTVLKEYFSDLSINRLDKMDDEFSNLLKQINRCIQVFKIEQYSSNLTQSVLKEIACDLIATTLMGTSYLLALFLELIGSGLEVVFAVAENSDDFETKMLRYLNNLPADYLQSREWYYRLHLVCIWADHLSKEHDRPSSKFDARLIMACQAVVENLNVYLDEIVTDDGKTSRYWMRFKDRLCGFANRSRAIEQCAQWSVIRHEDHYKKATVGYGKGDREMPRSSRTLHPLLRNLLAQGFIGKKIDLHQEMASRSNSEKPCGGPKELIERYGLTYVDAEKSPDKLIVLELFTHLYDIPWQSAYLRAMDFSDKECGLVPDKLADFTWHVHQHSALGRESYQLALDHYINDTESTCNRLSEVCRIVRKQANPNNDCPEKLMKHLKFWLDKDSDGSEEPPPSNRIWTMDNAFNLIKGSHGTHYGKSKGHREQLKIIGHKLEDLRIILSNFSPSLPPILRELYIFLVIRYKRKKDHEDYGKLLKSMSQEKKAGATQIQVPLPTYMIFKMCTAGRYAIPSKNADSSDSSLGVIDHPFSIDNDTKNEGIIYDGGKETALGFVLGRYDAITIQRVRPMFRSPLPRFNYPDENGDKGERFPSFFSRSELLTPINMGNSRWDDIEKKTIYAFISVTLSRSAARLDFLSRLLHWVEKIKSKEPVRKDQTLSHLATLLKVDDGDRIFLSDGWGDLLFAIAIEDEPKADAGRLEKLFQMQSILFEDFQTEKTELILTSHCVTDAFADGGINKFQVSMHVRLLEDRCGEDRNKKYVADISQKIDDPKIFPSSDEFQLTRTPGRMDFSIRGGVKTKEQFNALLNIMANDRVDRFQTNIGLISPITPTFDLFPLRNTRKITRSGRVLRRKSGKRQACF